MYNALACDLQLTINVDLDMEKGSKPMGGRFKLVGWERDYFPRARRKNVSQ